MTQQRGNMAANPIPPLPVHVQHTQNNVKRAQFCLRVWWINVRANTKISRIGSNADVTLNALHKCSSEVGLGIALPHVAQHRFANVSIRLIFPFLVLLPRGKYNLDTHEQSSHRQEMRWWTGVCNLPLQSESGGSHDWMPLHWYTCMWSKRAAIIML